MQRYLGDSNITKKWSFWNLSDATSIFFEWLHAIHKNEPFWTISVLFFYESESSHMQQTNRLYTHNPEWMKTIKDANCCFQDSLWLLRLFCYVQLLGSTLQASFDFRVLSSSIPPGGFESSANIVETLVHYYLNGTFHIRHHLPTI